jgi:hypothetical protein
VNYLLNRWIGRARFIFQYLIQNILQSLLEKCDNFMKNEHLWFSDATLKSLEYINSYENITIDSGKSNKEVTEVLKYIYFDLVMMRKKRKNITVIYPLAANLVNNGIMFLPSSLTKSKLIIHYLDEPISFYALELYFQKKRLSIEYTKIEHTFLKDPILEQCYDDLLQNGASMPSRYIWEDCLCRFFMLSLKPKLNSDRISIGMSEIMKNFVNVDNTIYFYIFEGVFVIDEDITENKLDFVSHLFSQNTNVVYYPNELVGNDITFTCSRLTYEECIILANDLSLNFDKEIYLKLPSTRNITIQTKFLTTDDNIDKKTLSYAAQTALIENSYLGKKNKDSNMRKQFEENFLNKKSIIEEEIVISKDIIDWNIGIVCISGSLPKDFQYNKIEKINNITTHLLGYITPLNFKFDHSELYQFLLNCCHLGDKSFKRNVEEIYDDNYLKITSFESLMTLTIEKLIPIAESYNIKKGKEKKIEFVNFICSAIKNKKIKLEE